MSYPTRLQYAGHVLEVVLVAAVYGVMGVTAFTLDAITKRVRG